MPLVDPCLLVCDLVCVGGPICSYFSSLGSLLGSCPWFTMEQFMVKKLSAKRFFMLELFDPWERLDGYGCGVESSSSSNGISGL